MNTLGTIFVRIELVGREGVSVIHRRQGTSLNLSGDRSGRKREAIELHIPQDVQATPVPQIVRDLETAFVAMGYGYVIARKAGIDIVPESEQQSAIAELHEMGYEIERLAGGRIRQTWRAGAPRPDIETLRKTTPRMMSLIQSVHGTRQRFEILAKSKEY